MTSDDYITALEQKQEKREEVAWKKYKRNVDLDLEINKSWKTQEKR